MSTIETLIADAVARRATAERERAAAREREQAEQRRRIVANCADDLARSLGAEIMAALDGAIVAEEGGREARLAFAVGGRQFTLVRQGRHSFRLVDVTGGQGARRVRDFQFVGGQDTADDLLIALHRACAPPEPVPDDLEF